MFKNMLSTLNNVGNDMGVKSSLFVTQKSIEDMVKGAKNSTDAMLSSYWPKIEVLLYSSLIGMAESKLKDDKSLATVFEAAYEVMPIPVRLVLSRERFVGFCLDRKESILEKMSLYKAEKVSSLQKPEDFNKVTTESSNEIDSDYYQSLLPELIALCIAADGKVEESEIELATAMIANDNFIKDKEATLRFLLDNIESLMSKKEKSIAIFKMQSVSIISKISKITKPEEKERINIIVEGMLSSVDESGFTETKIITEAIQKRFVEV